MKTAAETNSKQAQARILLVEDDANFGQVLKGYLELNNYDVTLSCNGMEGWNAFRQHGYDLCICDVMMPHKDGFTLAAEIKKQKPSQPLIFLTARALKDDMLQGFRIGADDYLTKPFDSELLLYKIRVVLKRNTTHGHNATQISNPFALGRYVVNFSTRQLLLDGKEQSLTPREAELLQLLCENLNGLMPRETALKQLWKEDNYFTARSMDVYIARLRKYLKQDPAIELLNISRKGYRLLVKGLG